jgi:hypothetical protein
VERDDKDINSEATADDDDAADGCDGDDAAQLKGDGAANGPEGKGLSRNAKNSS